MNKVLTIIITIILTAAVSSTATYVVVTKVLPEDKETTVTVNTGNGATQNNQNTNSEQKQLVGGEQTKTGAHNFGFDVDIKSARLTQNTKGESVVVVTYILNNPIYDEGAKFDIDFDASVYQNGIELNSNYNNVVEGDPYNDYYDLSNSEIKSGSTAEIQKDYVLINTTSDIVVEVEEDNPFRSASDRLFVSKSFIFN